MLLKRSTESGNPETWGLPGGNAEAQEAGDLLGTASREATEEMGELPASFRQGRLRWL